METAINLALPPDLRSTFDETPMNSRAHIPLIIMVNAVKVVSLILLLLAVSLQTLGMGITIVTHGDRTKPLDQEKNWVDGMGNAIATRIGGTKYVYRLNIVKGKPRTPSNPEGLGLGEFICENIGLEDIGRSIDAEVVIKLYWDTVADSRGSFINTDEVALAVIPALTEIPSARFLGRPLAESPIHLIGHSRGASLVAEIARLLGEKGIWTYQLTTLDPYPAPGDAAVNVYDTVLFADNYFQTDSIIVEGHSVPGATNEDLTGRLAGGYGDGIGGEDHFDPHLWYHGTIDLSSPAEDGDGGVMNAALRDKWYAVNQTRGTNAGFFYSRKGGGASILEGFVYGFNDGGHNLSPDKNRIYANRSTGSWPSLVSLQNEASSSVRAGSTAPLRCIYQSYDSKCSISVFLDTDENPYNGNEVALINPDAENDATGTSTKAIDLRAIVPSETPQGVYYVYGRITNSTGSRYLYAVARLFVQSSPMTNPQIKSLSPSNISTSPQLQTITIAGTGFSQNATLLFNGMTPSDPARIHNSGATQIEYDLLALSPGEWSVQVVNGETKSQPWIFYVSSENSAKQLTGLSISGPATVNENSVADSMFECSGNFSDGSIAGVTPVWSVVAGPGSISASGQLSAGTVNGSAEITVSASYLYGGILKTAIQRVIVVRRSVGESDIHNLIQNGDFKAGNLGWTLTGSFEAGERFANCNSCPGYAYLATPEGNAGNNLVGAMSQTFTIPSNALETELQFWHRATNLDGSDNEDQLDVQIHYMNGAFQSIGNIRASNANAYNASAFSLNPFKGQTVTLKFVAWTSPSSPTTFRIDDVSVAYIAQKPVGLGIRGPNSLLENTAGSFDVVVIYNDGSVKAPLSLDWAVSGSATISSSGSTAILTANDVSGGGAATLTAKYSEGGVEVSGFVSVAVLDVVPPKFVFLVIDGPDSVTEMTTAQFTATAIFDNGSRVSVPANSWTVDSPATITGLGQLSVGDIAADAVVTVSGSATIGGVTLTGTRNIPLTSVPQPPTLALLRIMGPNTLDEMRSGQFSATATFSDGSTQDVTPTWETDTDLANISNSGMLSVGDVSSDTCVTLSASFTSGGVKVSDVAFVVVRNRISPKPISQLADARINNQSFTFKLNGNPGEKYSILASSNLIDWVPRFTNITLISGSAALIDVESHQHPFQAYKAVPIPSSIPILIASNLNRPERMAFFDDFIYFVDNSDNDGILKRVSKSGGTAITILHGQINLYGALADFVISGNKIYGSYGGHPGKEIFVSSLDGDSRLPLITISGGKLIGVTNDTVYFSTTSDLIKSMPTSGGAFTRLAGNNWVRSSAVDERAIYFVEQRTHDIRKYEFESKMVSTLLRGNNFEGTLFIDGNNVYGNVGGKILKVTKDGSSVETLVSGEVAVGYVSDGINVFYVEGNLMKSVPVVGGPSSTVIDLGSYNILSLVADGDYLYWTDAGNGQGSGSIWRVSKPR